MKKSYHLKITAFIALTALSAFLLVLRFTALAGGGTATEPAAAPTPSTGCVPPPPGMVSWWTGDGNTNDIIGGNNGILQGGATFATGEVSQGFSLNGSTAYVLIGNPDSLKLNSLTIDAWVNPTSIPAGSDDLSVVTKWNYDCSGGSDGDSYGLWLANSSGDPGTLRVLAAVHPTNGCQIVVETGIVPLNTFSHVAMTYDATSGMLALYINGVQVGSASSGGANLVQSDVDVDIGRENNPPRFFPGIIDEVEIFNRALDTSEIAAIYNAGSAGKCKPPPTGANGSFVIGDVDAVVGHKVYFWGSQWAKRNTLSQGAAPSAFKGFANSVGGASPDCGGMWRSDPGNSSAPPSTVPAFITVIASSSVTKSGSVITGNNRKIVVVRTDRGYDSNPGHPGTGTVMSVTCQ